jgi:hypothetical protein
MLSSELHCIWQLLTILCRGYAFEASVLEKQGHGDVSAGEGGIGKSCRSSTTWAGKWRRRG